MRTCCSTVFGLAFGRSRHCGSASLLIIIEVFENSFFRSAIVPEVANRVRCRLRPQTISISFWPASFDNDVPSWPLLQFTLCSALSNHTIASLKTASTTSIGSSFPDRCSSSQRKRIVTLALARSALNLPVVFEIALPKHTVISRILCVHPQSSYDQRCSKHPQWCHK